MTVEQLLWIGLMVAAALTRFWGLSYRALMHDESLHAYYSWLLYRNYTEQQYVLRWHEPEAAIYRNFAIAPELEPSQSAWHDADAPHGLSAILDSIWSSLMTQTTPEGQQRLWRLIFFREMPAGTLNFTVSLFVRNDLRPTDNAIHYDGQHYSRPNA